MIRITSVLATLAIFAATAQAGAIWSPGAPGGTSGGSLEFDNGASGTGSFLDTNIPASAVGGNRGDGGSDYTISLWLNSDVDLSTGTQAWFLGTGDQGLHLGVRDNTLSQGHWGADSDGTTLITADTWFHTTFSYDADGGSAGTGEQKIYVNGVLEGVEDNIAANRSATSIILGARNNGGNGPQWDGQLDDVAFWNTQLSDDDISAIAAGASPTEFNAAVYYAFEDDQMGTIAVNTGTTGAFTSGLLGSGDFNLTGVTPIPEPSSLVLSLFMGLGVLGFARRKRN